MGFLDYNGLSHFLDKLKTTFILISKRGAADGVASLDSAGKVPISQLLTFTAGQSGVVPVPAPGKQIQYLKGDGTWDSPALSELGLSVVNGKVNITYQKEVDG